MVLNVCMVFDAGRLNRESQLEGSLLITVRNAIVPKGIRQSKYLHVNYVNPCVRALHMDLGLNTFQILNMRLASAYTG